MKKSTILSEKESLSLKLAPIMQRTEHADAIMATVQIGAKQTVHSGVLDGNQHFWTNLASVSIMESVIRQVGVNVLKDIEISHAM